MSHDGKGAATAAPEFPRTLAAVKEADGDQWMVANAVLFEVGRPSRDGERDSSGRRFKQCAEFLGKRGYTYEPGTLRRMRDTAVAFPGGPHGSASFAAHKAAGSPEIIEEAIRRNDGKAPTQALVEQLRRELREQAEREENERLDADRKKAKAKAKEERERGRKAKDEVERKEARARERAERKRAKEAEEKKRKLAEKQQKRQREKAEEEAERAAALLEDKKVAELVANGKSVGGRRIKNAVRDKEAAERRKTREENERRAQAEGVPLPAFVPKMVEEIGGWVADMRALTDDVGQLPPEVPFVQTLAEVVAELGRECERWGEALAPATEDKPIEGTGQQKNGPRPRVTVPQIEMRVVRK